MVSTQLPPFITRFQLTSTESGNSLPGALEQSLSGLRFEVNPKGPFPMADDEVQVTQPTGAGMIVKPLDCDVVVAGGGRCSRQIKSSS